MACITWCQGRGFSGGRAITFRALCRGLASSIPARRPAVTPEKSEVQKSPGIGQPSSARTIHIPAYAGKTIAGDSYRSG